jgi:hypothetical protein
LFKKPAQENSPESEGGSMILDDEVVSEEPLRSFQEMDRQSFVANYVLLNFPKGIVYMAKMVVERMRKAVLSYPT